MQRANKKMAKWLWITMVVFVFSLTSCSLGNVDVELDELIMSNTVDVLLVEYSSAMETYTNAYGTITRYVANDIFYYESPYTQEILIEDNMYGVYNGQYVGSVVLDDAREGIDEYYEYIGISGSTIDYETLISTKRSDGVNIEVITEISTEDYNEISGMLGYEYNEGDYLTNCYIINSDDYSIIESTLTVNSASGESQVLSTRKVEYNSECPSAASELYYLQMNSKDTWTKTVIVNESSDYAVAYTGRARDGEEIQILTLNVYEYYLDSACSIRYVENEEELTEDITLYCK